MLDLKAKRVVVIGLGASGVAAARLCLRRGARVVGTDTKPLAELHSEARALEAEGAELVVAGNDAAVFSAADLVVVSPGVPSFPALERAEQAGVRVIGEVRELAYDALLHPAPVIAIGGTNGKSTTTSLVGALCEAHGLKTFSGGNLGEPLAAHVDENFDAIVIEVSSFQMERIDRFHPRVSVLLNVTDDHLDRYPDFDAYARAKGNAFVHQTAKDAAIIPVFDPMCLREAKRGGGRIVTFGPGGDIDVTETSVIDRRLGNIYPRECIALEGGHNALNVAAAVAVANEFNIQPRTVTSVLEVFSGLPHRMARVDSIRGVVFYDDSKGTNVGAAVTALYGLSEPKAVLIAGGKDKGGSYGPLALALRVRGRAAVLLGEAAPLIERAIGNEVPVRRASTIDEAAAMALELANEGDAVLLSPACSSFDMFRDYKHRGDEFVRAVSELANRFRRAR